MKISFLEYTKQTGVGLSEIQHILSFSERNPPAAAGTVSTFGLLLSFSVIFCFSSLPVSFIQAELQPYENKPRETQTSCTLCSWSDSIIPSHVSGWELLFVCYIQTFSQVIL